MVLRAWSIPVVCALVLGSAAGGFAQRPPTAVPFTPTYGSVSRILTTPVVPTPGLFVNPTYRTPDGAYDSQSFGFRNTFPSTLLRTQGVFRPMAGAGSNDMSLRLNGPEDDDITRALLPPSGPAGASVYRPRPGEDLLASSGPSPLVGSVVLHVPANAQVWFDKNLTRSTGSERSFETPLLAPGKSYQYEITARWLRDDQPIERTRTVTVRPGERTVVDFADSGKP